MATNLTGLNIDLSDPQSIRERVPEIEGIVREKRRVASAAMEEFETWEALLGRLKSVAGLILTFNDSTAVDPPLAAVNAVVQMVEREERPIMAIGVMKALRGEGHEVESPNAVKPILRAAAEAGHLQRVLGGGFAPLSLDLSEWNEVPEMQVVPEAHFGLGDPAPRSKTEAAVRVLASDPSRRWSTPEVGQAMIAAGWMEDSDSDLASLASALSRLVAERKIFRPQRGQYQLARPVEEDAG